MSIDQSQSIVETYELFFIQDTFQIAVTQKNPDKKLQFLPETCRQIQSSKLRPFSFLKEDSVLESAIFERLQIQNTNQLSYLYISRGRLLDFKDKVWNQIPEIQKLYEISLELVMNYLTHSLLTPDDIFPERAMYPDENLYKRGPDQIAFRILSLFSQEGFDSVFFELFRPQFEQEYQDQIYISMLKIIYQEMKSMTIQNSRINFFFGIFQYFLENESLKKFLLNQQKIPFIPDNTGAPLKQLAQVRGMDLEIYSIFGPFLRISFFQPLFPDANYNQIQSRIYGELSQKQTKRSYFLRVNSFIQQQKDYTSNLIRLFQLLLKKDYLPIAFQFFHASLIGNVNRKKEAAILGNNKKIENYSSDAYMMNMYDIMLELSRRIFERIDDTYKKIDPEFWLMQKNIDLKDQPMLYEIVTDKPPYSGRNDAGNVSNLFFYTVKYAQLGLLGTIAHIKEISKQMKEIKKNLDNFKNAPQALKQKLQEQYDQYDRQAHVFECVLINDNQRIRDTVNLYETLIQLIMQWCQIDLNAFKDGQCQSYQPRWILNHFPEDIIIDIIEFHLFFCYYKQDYLQQILSQNQLINLLKFTTLLTTDIKFMSNKHILLKIVELIYIFLKIDNQKAIMKNIFINCEFAKQNLLWGCIKFYVEVEELGPSAFYQKFGGRTYLNTILIELFEIPYYRNQMIQFKSNQYLERMIKMILSDTNYSMDEGWAKIEKYIKGSEDNQLQQLNQLNQMQQIQQRNFMLEQAKSNLQSASGYFKIIAKLSSVLQDALLSDLYRDQLTMMFNHFLQLMFDPKYKDIIKVIEGFESHEFKQEKVLLNIATVYVNLMDNQEFKKSIIKDSRCYKFSQFTTLVNKINSNYNASEILKLNLINFTTSLQEVSEVDYDPNDIIQDVPEKYQCQLMTTIMKDPVKLPGSGVIVDRASIKTSLLDKEIDPFSRQPLKEKDLIELPELKKEIELWLNIELDKVKNQTLQAYKQKLVSQIKVNQNKMQTENIDDQDSSVFQGRRTLFQEE